jgi:hypothetical protein
MGGNRGSRSPLKRDGRPRRAADRAPPGIARTAAGRPSPDRRRPDRVLRPVPPRRATGRAEQTRRSQASGARRGFTAGGPVGTPKSFPIERSEKG